MATNQAGVQLGAYVGNPNNSDSAEQAGTTAQFNSLTSAMGQAPTMMDTYVDPSMSKDQWASDSQWAADSWAATSWAKNMTPVIGLPMADSTQTGDAAFKSIISGQYDSAILGVFQAWANDGYTSFYIRPGWEMNGPWDNWAIDSSNAADFVAAFQHIANLAHSFQGATIKTVWNPNVGPIPVSAANLYPGDSYVDVVGLDTYGAPVDTGDAPGNTSTDPNTFTLKDALALAKAHGKPFALPETGGLDATFAQQLGSVIAASGDQVAFVNLWDINDTSGNLSWSNASDKQSAVAAAWKQAFATISAANTGSGSGSGTPVTTASPPPATSTAPTTTKTTSPTTPTTTGTTTAGTTPSTTSTAPVTTASPPPVTTASPPPVTTTSTAPDTLDIGISEDAWQGDAQFTVSVDGKQVGGTMTAHALHSSGDAEHFLLTGNWGSGQHNVKISFINDAYGGTAATDRNLYVNSVALDGTTYAGTSAALFSNGSRNFTVGGTTKTASAAPDKLVLHLSEDAWKGNAQFQVSVDGKTIDTPEAVTVQHASGKSQDVTITGNFGSGPHDIGVKFANDAYGGTAATDRNLYVNGVTFDSHNYTGAALFSNGTAHFTVSA